MLKPTLALVDPLTTHHLPQSVVAAAGMDVVMHAAESFTARPFSARPLGPEGSDRPLNQGQNPWSDIGCRETLAIAGRFFARALTDPTDVAAREAMHWAATLAGTALNNAGTALPHGCSYPISGGVKASPHKRYTPASGYSNRAGTQCAKGGADAGASGSSDQRGESTEQASSLLPHGYAVAVMAPSAFLTTAAGSPERHHEAAMLLGSKGTAATHPCPEESGGLLADELIALMRLAGDCPLGLGELGFTEADVPAMVQGTIIQQRVLSVVPVEVDEAVLSATFRRALDGYR